jgi:hypothetical protein
LWVFKKIAKFFRISVEDLLDIFKYEKQWDTKVFFDAFKAPWNINETIYCNPPFS